jgi:transcription elongation factor GreA-like protein
MRALQNMERELCRKRFNAIIDRDADSFDASVFISHFGFFSQDFVNNVVEEIETRLLETGEKKSTVKRIFSILVEGLQNIRLHSECDSEGEHTSFFIITQSVQNYSIYLGNIVFNNNIEKIKTRINQVNALNEEEVKQLYLNVLTNGIISSKGGAGLGFITMAMKSKNKIEGFFETIDETISHYDLKLTVDRE